MTDDSRLLPSNEETEFGLHPQSPYREIERLRAELAEARKGEALSDRIAIHWQTIGHRLQTGISDALRAFNSSNTIDAVTILHCAISDDGSQVETKARVSSEDCPVPEQEYIANMLESSAMWLQGNSTTVWAEEFGHTALMQSYAKFLRDLRQKLGSVQETSAPPCVWRGGCKEPATCKAARCCQQITLQEKASVLRKTRYCDYDLCPHTFDPAHSNNDH